VTRPAAIASLPMKTSAMAASCRGLPTPHRYQRFAAKVREAVCISSKAIGQKES
jgi:hypothetical protein